MLTGDPHLDREVRAEIKASGQRRRRTLIVVAVVGVVLLVLFVLTATSTPEASAQSRETTMEGVVRQPDAGGGSGWPSSNRSVTVSSGATR